MDRNKEKNFISAVVYIHDNEDDIDEFLSKINSVLSDNFEKYEIICVDDKSTDDSIKIIKDFGNKVSGVSISIISMSYFQGLELSMNAGVDLAIGDFVFEFDSIVLDYDLALITDVYFQSLKGFDIVSVTPRNKIKISSKIFYKIFNKNARMQYALNTESFRILSRRSINRILSMSKTIPYRKAIYSNCGLKIFNILYIPTSNDFVKQIYHKEQRKDLALNSLVLFTDIAYRFTMFMVVFMIITTVLSGAYAFFIFFNKSPIAGWTTTILFISAGFFGIFVVLAVIIKYLSILLDLIFKKQKYIIESIDKIGK